MDVLRKEDIEKRLYEKRHKIRYKFSPASSKSKDNPKPTPTPPTPIDMPKRDTEKVEELFKNVNLPSSQEKLSEDLRSALKEIDRLKRKIANIELEKNQDKLSQNLSAARVKDTHKEIQELARNHSGLKSKLEEVRENQKELRRLGQNSEDSRKESDTELAVIREKLAILEERAFTKKEDVDTHQQIIQLKAEIAELKNTAKNEKIGIKVDIIHHLKANIAPQAIAMVEEIKHKNIDIRHITSQKENMTEDGQATTDIVRTRDILIEVDKTGMPIREDGTTEARKDGFNQEVEIIEEDTTKMTTTGMS